MRDEPSPRTGVAEHTISSRNNTQVRFAGMTPTLRQLGYRRGARVTVVDLTEPQNEAWEFVVSNNEDATITCGNPPPPAWVQPGVRVRIEVTSAPQPEAPPVSPATQPVAEAEKPKELPGWLSKLGAWLAHHIGQILVAVIVAVILAYLGVKK
jgi:hypothetical protein